MQRWVLIDFETASYQDLPEVGAYRYAQDPTTEVICLGWYSSVDNQSAIWRQADGYDHVLAATAAAPDVMFVAHNVGFDRTIWREIMVKTYGFPDIPDDRWHDTMAMCAMKVLPQDLDRALQTTGVPFSKDREGSKLTKSLSKFKRHSRDGLPKWLAIGQQDRSPETLQRVYDYCRSDIQGTVALHRRLGWMPPGERQVWLLDQKINERGVQLDLPYVRSAIRLIEKAKAPLVKEFKALTGDLDFSQRAEIMRWCDNNGARLENLQKDYLAKVLGGSIDEDDYDPDDVEDFFAPRLPDNVRRALEIRQLLGSASIAKLPRMLACAGPDGRARGLLQYHGAGPGRWAGRIIQPQNFPRGTLKVGKKSPDPEALVDAVRTEDPEFVGAVLGPPIETVVHGLRHAIIAGPGRLLGAGDFAGIEARVVLALAGQTDKVALLASGADVYCDMAGAIYGRPITKADAAERQTGKNSVLGLGFQMGAKKFRFRYCPDQPLEFAQGVVDAYRQTWAPEVPKLWKALMWASTETVWSGEPHTAYGVTYRMENGWLSAELPSRNPVTGEPRKLWYWNPQPVRRSMPWDETDIRPAWTYQALKQGKWLTITAFGGLLTENVVQAIARDLLVHTMFACEREGLPLVLTVHDENLVEAPAPTWTMLDQIMTERPTWAEDIGVPIAVEGWIGERYKK